MVRVPPPAPPFAWKTGKIPLKKQRHDDAAFCLLHSVVINDEAHENQVLLSRIFQPVAAAVWAEHGISRLHLIGGVVVGIQTVTGEDVIDFSISFVLVHAHGAALFQGGLHLDPSFVFQYVRPRNRLENDAAFTAVGMFNDFGWNFWNHKIFLLSLDEWGMGLER